MSLVHQLRNRETHGVRVVLSGREKIREEFGRIRDEAEARGRLFYVELRRVQGILHGLEDLRDENTLWRETYEMERLSTDPPKCWTFGLMVDKRTEIGPFPLPEYARLCVMNAWLDQKLPAGKD